MMANYWLMKSEPDVFSIDDLKDSPNKMTSWDGIRNYQARNFMRNEMKIGDLVLFYHSSTKPPGVAGIAKVASEAYPDSTSWDKKSKYFDSKSTKENPRWFMLDIKFKKKFKRLISLQELKQYKELSQMKLLQKGNRLSIMPVTKEDFNFILNLE